MQLFEYQVGGGEVAAFYRVLAEGVEAGGFGLREGEGVETCLFCCEVGFFLPFVFGVEVVAGSTAYEDYCAKLTAYGETLFAETFAFYDTLTEEKPE